MAAVIETKKKKVVLAKCLFSLIENEQGCELMFEHKNLEFMMQLMKKLKIYKTIFRHKI